MELQFVFGNPRTKGKSKSVKKPLPKTKERGKLKEGIERSHTMAKRKKVSKVKKTAKPVAKRVAKKATKAKRKPARRKNPTQYYVDTGKYGKGRGGLRLGRTKLQPVGLPIPDNEELKNLKADIARAAKFETKARLTKSDLETAAKLAEALGDSAKAAELRDRVKAGLHGLDSADIMQEIHDSGVLKRIGLLKRYVTDIERNGARIRDEIKRAGIASRKGLKSREYPAYGFDQEDIESNDPDVQRGLPASFYDSLSRYYGARHGGAPMKRKHKHRKAKNPVLALEGVEAYQEQNARKTKKKKKSVKKAHKRKKSKKSTGLVSFTIGSKALRKKVRKMKKGSTISGRVKIRKNPMLPSIPALRKFLGLDLQPMAMLAVAAASTGVVNGLVRFGLNKAKLGDKLSGTVARNLVPSAGPMLMAVLLNVLGDKMKKPVLRELGEAFATVGIVSLGVNTLGGVVTRVAGTLPGMKGALAGYDASIGLLPEGMSGLGEDDADFGAEGPEGIGEEDADFGGVTQFDGVSAYDGIPEGMNGVSAFDGIPEGMGDDDADFGEDDADFGEGDAIG
jgi:hypothetical protein